MILLQISLSGLGYGVELNELKGKLHDQVSAYCGFEKTLAKLKSDLLVLPTAFSRTNMRAESSFENQGKEAHRTASQLGLRYSVAEKLRGDSIVKFADSECNYYKYQSLLNEYFNSPNLQNEIIALKAKHAVYLSELDALKYELNAIETKFETQNATLQQLYGWQQLIYKLEKKSAILEIRIQKLELMQEQKQPVDNADIISRLGIKEIIAQSNNWQKQLLKNKIEIEETKNWDIYMSGGYEYRDVEYPVDVPIFLEFGVEYRFGNLKQNQSELKRVINAKIDSTNWDVNSQIQNNIREVELKRKEIAIQIQLLNSRRIQIGEQQLIIQSQGDLADHQLYQKLRLENIFINAEYAYYSSKYAELIFEEVDSSNITQQNNLETSLTVNPADKNVTTLEGLNLGYPVLGENNNVSDLLVTSGVVSSRDNQRNLFTQSKTMRMHSRKTGSNNVELHFTYVDLIENAARLSSGELRHQVGVFMNAKNQCNLIYVMLRIGPIKSKIVVQKKHNPNKKSHKECGALGYETIEPNEGESFQNVMPGIEYVLKAEIISNQLFVYLNDTLVWKNIINLSGLPVNGYAGVRSDNVIMEFKFKEHNQK